MHWEGDRAEMVLLGHLSEYTMVSPSQLETTKYVGGWKGRKVYQVCRHGHFRVIS
jgi:hypothetical protein